MARILLLLAWCGSEWNFGVEGREVRVPLEYPRLHSEKIFTAKQCREIRARAQKDLRFSVGSSSVTSEKQSRRARFAGVPRENFFYGQIYHRLWRFINASNEKLWRFPIAPGAMEIMQYSIYNSSDLGMYNWHEDVGFHSETAARVLSVSIQVSSPKSYDGGALQLRYGDVVVNASQDLGTAILFPSHVTHRVLPVTRGERHSLVLWLQLDAGASKMELLDEPTCKVQVNHPDGRELSLQWTGKDSPEESARNFGLSHHFPQRHMESLTSQLSNAMKKQCVVL